MPARNEEKSIPLLLKKIIEKKQKNAWQCELVLVDDHSTDNTWKIIEKISKKNEWVSGHRVLGKEKGMGVALKKGTEKAKNNIVIWVMADLSDNLKTINKLVKIASESQGIVIGTRKLSFKENGLKAIFSKTYSLACKALFGLKAKDVTNAFRAFDKRILKKVNLESNNFAISPELTIKAHIHGFKVRGVQSNYKKRIIGKSKFNVFLMFLPYLYIILKLYTEYIWIKLKRGIR